MNRPFEITFVNYRLGASSRPVTFVSWLLPNPGPRDEKSSSGEKSNRCLFDKSRLPASELLT